MSFYAGAILLTELLMVAMMYHVAHYPGFSRVEKRWYLFVFITVFFCAGAEFAARHFDGCGPSFVLPLTVLTVIQFSLSPMLPVFFGGALGIYRPAIVVGTVFCLHALAEVVLAPFGLIFYFDEAGKYIRGEYYIIYEITYILSLVFMIVSMIAVSRRFKRRDLPTLIMAFVLTAASIVPLILFRVYTDYIGIGLCASLCYIYYNDLIQEDIQEKLVANQDRMFQMQEHTISAMSRLIESRNVGSGEHVSRISEFVGTLAEDARRDGVYVETLDDDFISKLRMMAPMHDIGKIVVSDRILTKPGKLTEEEFECFKRHAPEGGRIVREVLSGVTEEEYVSMASDLATYHHERWDGRGYPEGLSGENIPLSARIMAIADVFDALISERYYKEAVSKEQAFDIIRQESGTHFDPHLAEVFLNHREDF
ncbi:MAG: HD domain-containing protein [Oscillospiraceae bacterium]|nr:HD domain-containing protein [Oscillospiraceae bacterium]